MTNNVHAVANPKCRWMTADHDRALLLLSAGYPVTIAHVRAHVGIHAHAMVRALRDLTIRNLAVFEGGAYHLAGEKL